MRSKPYFALRAFLIIVLAITVLVASLFALSFLFFTIHESGERFLLSFGRQGLMTFVELFPWIFLFIFLILVAALELLMRRHTLAYRLPILLIFWLLLAVGIVGSAFIEFTPIHPWLLSEADSNQLPILGPLYESIHDSRQEQGVYRGVVTSVTNSNFVISHDDGDRDSDDGTWMIVPPNGFDLSSVSIGSKLYVAGNMTNGVVYAYGIHTLGHR
ncbi:MAG: hypothetical protein WAW90_02945, partial [Minisyncoccia bacterium]